MPALHLSSGDLIADRRASYAEMLWQAGDRAAAVDLMRDVLALVPLWAAGWFRLGEMLDDDKRSAEAADAWREALRLDPGDRAGAVLKLAGIGAATGLEAVPSAFVETLFDQYAGRFDAALVETLDYRVPELIVAAMTAAGRESFRHALDLGCGTGLMGERLRGRASYLEGVDISAGMLKRAEAKRIYDALARQDLHVLAADAARADLVTAADVLIYVGALDRLFATVAGLLLPGGWFAFSVEHHDGPEPMALRASRRYAHSRAGVLEALAGAGLEPRSIEDAIIRMDRGEPLVGLIVVAEKQAVQPASALRVVEDDVAAEHLPLPH
ncbi:MAG: methyltransferase domain-containing protein [Rhizobiaceae bacterium]|nr:methyltransferase domain-containing protein [Rhizobiaceae bacterium]